MHCPRERHDLEDAVGRFPGQPQTHVRRAAGGHLGIERDGDDASRAGAGMQPPAVAPLREVVAERDDCPTAHGQVLKVHLPRDGLAAPDVLGQRAACCQQSAGLGGDAGGRNAGGLSWHGDPRGQHSQAGRAPGVGALRACHLDLFGRGAGGVVDPHAAALDVGHVDDGLNRLSCGHVHHAQFAGVPADGGQAGRRDGIEHIAPTHLLGEPVIKAVALHSAVHHEGLQALNVDLAVGLAIAPQQPAIGAELAASELQDQSTRVAGDLGDPGRAGPHRAGCAGGQPGDLIQRAVELAAGLDLDANHLTRHGDTGVGLIAF